MTKNLVLKGKWVMINDPPYQKINFVDRETEKKVFLNNGTQFLKKHIWNVFDTQEQAKAYYEKISNLNKLISDSKRELTDYIYDNRSYRFEG